MNILCTICERSGSKGIKNKNIKLLNGKPLIYYTIQQAVKSKIFKNIVVSTDSKKIQKISIKFGASSWFLRQANLSGDNISKIKVIRDSLKKSEKYYKKKFDYIVDLDATSPLRKIIDIKKSFKFFKKKKYDNLFSVCESSRNPYFNIIEKNKSKVKLVKKTKNIFSRQKAPKTFDLNASIYIWKRKTLLKRNTLFNSKTGIYLMPKNRSFDIDTYTDFKIVSFLIKNK